MITINRSDVKMKREIDEWPDLSWLGEYSDKWEEGAIERNAGSREYKYFLCGCGDPEYIEQDYERMEAYNRGEWCMFGIWAEVEIEIPFYKRDRTFRESILRRDPPLNYWKMETITSGGLWGVESDGGEDYHQEIFEGECKQLDHILAELGIEIVEDGADADPPSKLAQAAAAVFAWLDGRHAATQAEISAFDNGS